MPGARQAMITTNGHRTEINPESRALTLAVMARVQEEGLPLAVNDCSMQSKFRQLRGRRRSLSPLVKASYEKLVADQVLESYCFYWDENESRFCHPDSIAETRRKYPDYQVVRLVRRAPLSLQDNEKWIAFEKLK
jgi:hypothetical protein